MKTLLKIIAIFIFVSSCAIHRVNYRECEDLTTPGHLSWIINDSCYHAEVSSFESHRCEVIEYEKAYGTLYVYVKLNEKIFQVIILSLHILDVWNIIINFADDIKL